MCLFRCVFRCVVSCVMLCVSLSVCLNLLDEAVTFTGPTGSLFGFSIDFHTINNRSFVVVGAPKANTNQSGVTEGGGVFLCPWSPGSGACDIIDFDPTGDSALTFHTFKSGQWFGASVRSVSSSHLLACAPFFQWNVQSRGMESGKTPVGNCLLLDHQTGSSTPFSPCRGILMEDDYKRMNNRNDQRFCEVGFSADITKDGRLILGAPGSFFFQGEWTHLQVDIIKSGRSNSLIQNVEGISQSDERGGYDLYRGEYSEMHTCDEPHRSLQKKQCYYISQDSELVASYFGHSVAVTDVNGDGLEDVLVGAPLFMDRVMEMPQERGQVVLYLQKRHGSFPRQPDQSLIGPSLYGRFGSALAGLGDLDMDGYQDVAVGAPWSGVSGRGQVFIYLGSSNGLSAKPSQVIDSPLPGSRTAFGFSLRSGNDIDENGYPDLLVGAWAADRAFLYRSQAVIRSRVSVSLLPDFLNPDVKLCHRGNTPVSCFVIQMCVHVSGHRIPQNTALWVELQLDRMKQPTARRTLLLLTNQPQEMMKLTVQREVGVACINRTAYLRVTEVRDKLSPIFISMNVSLLNTTQHALLHGQTHAATQTRIILDCGDDNICVPDLKLSAEPVSDSVLVGGDQSVLLSVSAVNNGEGAYETELVVRLPEHTHFQSSQVTHPHTHTLPVCGQRKDNQTILVTCDLGNPMRQGHSVSMFVTMETLLDIKNSVSACSNQVSVNVQVRAEATLEIRGGSTPPEVVLPLPDWKPAVHPESLEEVGPLVEHVYELRNQGPSSVNVRLTVDFPSTWRHHFLLYVFANATEESLSCWTLNASQIDPFKVSNLSACLSVHLFVRSSLQFILSPLVQQEETNSHRQTVHVNCSSSNVSCIRFACDAMALERDFSAVIRISARLVMMSCFFLQTPYLNYELVSSASYDVINTSSKVQPLLLQSGHTQTQLNVTWRPPDGQKEVPIGYIILSIVSGLLLLCLLCFIFWKLGFFRRTRPPTTDDDDDDDDDDNEEQRLAEESHMTE
uniref:Integrin subunit alpha 2b n=1 Tax=Stegastes partitus TaxID=144197 RepID=A0A3B5ACV6_9TELE